jgi:hypothetical protein
MSTESTIFVTLEITLPEGNEDFPLPKQKLDEGEFVSQCRCRSGQSKALWLIRLSFAKIEIRLVPLRGKIKHRILKLA